ncbi:unnamed protein product [Cuscuta epithymum]|uniref:PGG domain-containing protein n=1 Tax=Cuscuta epithymum TaxID=186058 RepID=A0AAV0GHL1_9ASTE|nr:unnamed protein product [Cuscuta epithymum]CAH9147440.1 unnamed protein product [Cuscuta epithymum]
MYIMPQDVQKKYGKAVAYMIAGTGSLIAAIAMAGFMAGGSFNAAATARITHQQRVAFDAFVVSDAVAVACSLAATFASVMMMMRIYESRLLHRVAASLTVLGLYALCIAFVTGMYSLSLPRSPPIAVTLLVFGLLFVPLSCFLLCINIYSP